MNLVEEKFLSTAVFQFEHIKKRAEKAIDQLTEQDLHWRPNSESNSIAIIIKHLSGNMHSRWTNFLTTDGEKEYRDRDGEFLDTVIEKKNYLKFGKKAGFFYLKPLKSYKQKTY